MRPSKPIRPWHVAWRAPYVTLLVVAACAAEAPPPAPQPHTPADAERARAIATRCVALHGGIEAWKKAGNIRFTAKVRAPGGAGGAASDAPQTEIRFTFDYVHRAGRMEFPADPGNGWGTDGKETWFIEGGKLADHAPGPEALPLPIEAMFFAVPFYLFSPTADIFYEGTADYEGRQVDSVRVAPKAGQGGPERSALLYFDPTTAEVLHVRFDVEGTSGVRGEASYVEWQKAGKLTLPKVLEIGAIRPTRIKEGEIRFEDVQVGVSVPAAFYRKPAR